MHIIGDPQAHPQGVHLADLSFKVAQCVGVGGWGGVPLCFFCATVCVYLVFDWSFSTGLTSPMIELHLHASGPAIGNAHRHVQLGTF